MMKKIFLWLALTSSALAQQFNQAYIRYFSGEMFKGIYSYNYFESYNDKHYLSSLVSKDFSQNINEDLSTEVGIASDVILERDNIWRADLGTGVYAQIPTPDFAYLELYFLPLWLEDNARYVGSNLSIDINENLSIYTSIEVGIENKKTSLSSWEVFIEHKF